MSVAFVGTSADYALTGGTTACTFQNSDSSMPTVTAGQMLIGIIGWGNVDEELPGTPAGWTYVSTVRGGAGTFTGEDLGPRSISLWYRIADGTENGQAYVFPNPSPAVTGQVSLGYCLRFSRTLSYWEIPQMTGGSDNTAGGAYSATMASNIGATTGDMYLAASATNPAATNSAMTTAWPGVNGGSTTMTDCKTGQQTAGYNVRTNVRYKAVTSGTATGAPVITGSLDVIGPSFIVRLRDTNTSPNQAPVADAGNDALVEPFVPFTLDATGSADTEGNITTYAWVRTGTNTGTCTISNANTASASAVVVPSTVADEDYVFQVTVTDVFGLSDTATVTKTVLRSAESCYRNGVLKPLRIISA